MNTESSNTIKEYLVTVYDYERTRLGAYSAFATSTSSVYDRWLDRRNDHEYFVDIKFVCDTKL